MRALDISNDRGGLLHDLRQALENILVFMRGLQLPFGVRLNNRPDLGR